MSYTTIDIPGKGPEGAALKVGLKFGFDSYEMVLTAKNMSALFDEDGNPTNAGVARIIYSGYYNNCLNKNVELDMEFDDFRRAINEISKTPEGLESLTAIIKIWTESNDIQNLINTVVEKKSQLPEEVSKEILTGSENLPTESSESTPGS